MVQGALEAPNFKCNLFSDEQHDPFEELVAVKRGDGQVEEESVKDWPRNQFQVVNEEYWKADQDVRQDARHSRLTNTDDSDEHENQERSPISEAVWNATARQRWRQNPDRKLSHLPA